jgi:hypothetical protein
MSRFFVPILGLIFLLVAWGLEGWMARFELNRSARVVVASLLIAGLFWLARKNFRGPDYDYVQQDTREVATWTAIGKWLRVNAAPGDSIAVIPAGAMPYFSGLKTLDMLGLNDETIAHTEVPMGVGDVGHEKFNTEYVLQQSPTFVFIGIYSFTTHLREPLRMIRPFYPIETSLLSSEAFARRYRPEVGQTPSGGYFTYFKRVE